MYTLYIGNKNYSSWSLRGWLATKLSGAPFREVMVALHGQRTTRPTARSRRPALVPVPARRRRRRLGLARDRRVPGRAASGHVARRRRPRARGRARSAPRCTRAFAALRNEMTMCIRERVDVRPWSDALAARHRARRARSGPSRGAASARAAPYLCGAFSLADAFYAPVAFRFQTYDVRPAGAAGDVPRGAARASVPARVGGGGARRDDGHRGRRAARPLSRQARRRRA